MKHLMSKRKTQTAKIEYDKALKEDSNIIAETNISADEVDLFFEAELYQEKSSNVIEKQEALKRETTEVTNKEAFLNKINAKILENDIGELEKSLNDDL